MPYKIVQDGKQYCVHKENVDGSVGALVPGGCHPEKSKASAHMRALYSAMEREKKDLTDDQMELIVKEMEIKSEEKSSYFPSTITSWEELDAWRESEDAVNELRSTSSDFQGLVADVLWDMELPTIPEKTATIKALADGLSPRLAKDIAEAKAEDAEDSETKSSAADNNLPDSAFLYVESGGKKDSEGKTTPRSLRHLPYKKADGSIDLPRLRNALSRLGQSATGKVEGESWLSESLRSRLQSRAKKLLASANKSMTEKARDWFATLFGWEIKEIEPEQHEDNLMLWKENDGSWTWMARYSNNFRDRDNPPEIIASVSHQKFVEKVDKGIAPYPELWLWHRPEWKWGTAKWVGYDDKGFALAMGKVDPGCDAIAEYMATIDPKELRVSHGMPKKSIVRDPEDPTVIIEHVTAEISPLPSWAAANMLTSFIILNKEDKMAIPNGKREELINMGIPAEVLNSLMQKNAEVAKEASDAGIESKEAASQAAPIAPETTPTAVPPVTSVPVIIQKETVPVEPPKASPTPTAQEIAEAVSGVLNERLTAIDQRFATIETAIAKTQEEMKALKETDETKITKAVAQTPIASLSAMIARSVIGNYDTVVDGRSSLAKSKPTETEAPADRPNIGVWVVDQIMKEADQKPK